MSPPTHNLHPWPLRLYGALGLLLLGFLLGLALLYHSLPDSTFLLKAPPAFLPPHLEQALLAQAECEPRQFSASPLAILRTVWLEEAQGCHQFSHQLAWTVFQHARRKRPSRLEETLMAFRLETELPPARLIHLALSRHPLAVTNPAIPDTPVFGGVPAPPPDLSRIIQETRQLVQTPSHAAPIPEPGTSKVSSRPHPNSALRPHKLRPKKRKTPIPPKPVHAPPVPLPRIEPTDMPPTLALRPARQTLPIRAKERWQRLKSWFKRPWRKVKQQPPTREARESPFEAPKLEAPPVLHESPSPKSG